MQFPPVDAQGRFVQQLQSGSTTKRCFAKLLDAVVAGLTTFGFSFVLPLPFASALGTGWFCLADWAGSPGKWLFRLRTVTLDGDPVGPLAAFKRNLVLGLPTFARALLTSGVLGLQGEAQRYDRGMLACIGLAVFLGELVGMVMQPQNRRWGDTFARTRVVER